AGTHGRNHRRQSGLRIGLMAENTPRVHRVEIAQAVLDTEILETTEPERRQRTELRGPLSCGLDHVLVDVDTHCVDSARCEPRGHIADPAADVDDPGNTEGTAPFEEPFGRRPTEPRNQ